MQSVQDLLILMMLLLLSSVNLQVCSGVPLIITMVHQCRFGCC
jgi:hypothetical protein